MSVIEQTYDLKGALRQHFGFDHFKGAQQNIIENIIDENNIDDNICDDNINIEYVDKIAKKQRYTKKSRLNIKDVSKSL